MNREQWKLARKIVRRRRCWRFVGNTIGALQRKVVDSWTDNSHPAWLTACYALVCLSLFAVVLWKLNSVPSRSDIQQKEFERILDSCPPEPAQKPPQRKQATQRKSMSNAVQ